MADIHMYMLYNSITHAFRIRILYIVLLCRFRYKCVNVLFICGGSSPSRILIRIGEILYVGRVIGAVYNNMYFTHRRKMSPSCKFYPSWQTEHRKPYYVMIIFC